MLKRVVSVPKAGRVLNLGEYASYKAADRGEIPVITLGRRKVVPIRALEDLLGLEPGSLCEADFADDKDRASLEPGQPRAARAQGMGLPTHQPCPAPDTKEAK